MRILKKKLKFGTTTLMLTFSRKSPNILHCIYLENKLYSYINNDKGSKYKPLKRLFFLNSIRELK